MNGEMKEKRFTLLTVISVNLMTAVSGMAFGWSSPSIPKLQGHSGPSNNPLGHPATIREISWITALHNLGALCGPLFTGYIASKLGKKRTLLLFAIPQLCGNVILIFASKVAHFYVARFLLGMGTGCVFSIVPGYVADVSDNANRGSASIILSLSIIGSQLFLYCVAPYVTISTFAIISLVPSALFLLLFGGFVPEPPSHQPQKAEEILLEAGGQKGVVETSCGEIVGSREVRRAFVITLGLMFFQQCSGNACIASYMQTIFDSSETSLAGHQIVMLVGSLQLVVTILVTKIADKVGRKKLLGLSYLGQLVALVLLGLYFHLQAKRSDLASYGWVPAASVLLMLGSFKLGCGPISWTVTADILPPDVKYYMNSLVAFEMTAFSFVSNLLFPEVAARYGMAETVWGFGGIVVLAILFVGYVVPETKGKSLDEIQEMLREGGGKKAGRGTRVQQ